MDISILNVIKESEGLTCCKVRSSRGDGFGLLEEDTLAEEMGERVEPLLEGIAITGRFDASCKAGTASPPEGLYYELYPRENPLGTVVISYGFTESARKYREFIFYLYSYGFQVAVSDHRGHGKSLREVEDTSLVHVESFRQYVEDLHLFVHNIVIPVLVDRKQPGIAGLAAEIEKKEADGRNRLYLYGHSMGGCIAARYLELYPHDFSRAVLNAPMLGVKLGLCPSFAAALLCDLNILLGRGKHMLFYQHGFQPDEPFDDCSADSEARFRYYHSLRLKDTSYQTYSASYRWAREAIRAGKRALRRKEAARVTARVLLFQAENDSLVTPGAQKRFLERIPDGRLVVVPGTRHEIYRAGNRILKPYLEKVCTFLDGD